MIFILTFEGISKAGISKKNVGCSSNMSRKCRSLLAGQVIHLYLNFLGTASISAFDPSYFYFLSPQPLIWHVMWSSPQLLYSLKDFQVILNHLHPRITVQINVSLHFCPPLSTPIRNLFILFDFFSLLSMPCYMWDLSFLTRD